MSFVLLYSFEVPQDTPTDHYDVYGDFDLMAVQVRQNNVIISSGTTFTADDTGFNDNDIIKQQCIGFTLQQANALLAFPYAAITTTANAGFCGYSSGSTTCDLVIGTVTKNAVNETASGKISVSVSPGGSYEYSIDGLAFQSSNIFSNLPAGNYIIYVRRLDGSCQTNRPITLGKDIVETSPNFFTIPYQDSKHLFFFFRLIIGDTTTDITEPIKWDGITISGERDTKFHGYKFKYTDGNTVLGFDCDCGKDLIKAEYDLHGEDGTIKFQYGYSYFGVEYILFPGQLDLTTYHWFADRVECSVQVDDFDATFQSRQDTKVSMTANTSFEGTQIAPPQPYNLLFHPKTILTEFKVVNEQQNIFQADPVRQKQWSVNPDTTNGESSDIQETQPYSFGPTSGFNKDLNIYNVQFAFAGDTNIVFNWQLTGHVNVDNNGVIDGADIDINTVYVYQRYNPSTDDYTTTQTLIGQAISHHVGVLDDDDITVDQNIAFTLNNFHFNPKDRIYFYTYLASSRKVRTTWTIAQSFCQLDVKQTQESEESRGNVWFIDDVVRQTLNVIADNRYVFKSSFFERKNLTQLTDGCAAKSALTNGFQIRQFDVNEKPLYINFTTVINSLNAMYCIGIGYSNINNTPTVRFERADFFYQDKEILQITPDYIPGGIEQYDEEVAKEMIYNDVKIGYNKYQEDGYNSLDEVNTYREYLTPIQKNKVNIELLSDLITSPYSIEDIRRQQFADQPQDSVTNDDEAFFVTLKRDGNADWLPERDEPFAFVANLISPDTSYNLRVSPARMLFNWFIWLKGFLVYKLAADLITNTFFVQNGLMQTQFKYDEPCPVGDINKEIIQENETVQVGQLAATPDIYRPEWVNVKCRLTPDKVQILNMSLSGEFGPSKDYGYIMVKKPDGGWQAGWVYNLSYNYVTEQCTIKMLKKYYTPQTVDPDCCDWLKVNGCYVLANDNRLIA